jgi:hypothetical protein
MIWFFFRLDVADFSQSFVIPQSPVQFLVAGNLLDSLYDQSFENANGLPRRSACAFLVISTWQSLFYVVEV